MAAAPVQKPFLQFIEEVDLRLNPPEGVQDEVAKFIRLQRIVFAHFVATSVMQPNLGKVLQTGETHIYSYREDKRDLLDDAVLRLAQQALRERYGDVSLQPQDATQVVDVIWKGPLPQVDAQDQRNGQLFFYTLKNQMGLALRVIDQGAQVNARGPYDRTPLYAVMKEPAQLDLLIGKKANVNVIDGEGFSPLDVACFYGPRSDFSNLLRKYKAERVTT